MCKECKELELEIARLKGVIEGMQKAKPYVPHVEPLGPIGPSSDPYHPKPKEWPFPRPTKMRWIDSAGRKVDVSSALPKTLAIV